MERTERLGERNKISAVPGPEEMHQHDRLSWLEAESPRPALDTAPVSLMGKNVPDMILGI